MLAYTQQLLAMRQAFPALIHGSISLLETPEQIVAFIRSSEAGDVLCAFNLSNETVDWQPDTAFAEAKIIADEGEIGSHKSISGTMNAMTGYWAVLGD